MQTLSESSLSEKTYSAYFLPEVKNLNYNLMVDSVDFLHRITQKTIILVSQLRPPWVVSSRKYGSEKIIFQAFFIAESN